METTFQYIRNLNAIRGRLIQDSARPAPSWVRITTITMCSKFLQDIDLKKFRENFAKLGSITVRRRGSRFRGFEWKMKETAFYNQVTIGYEDVYSRKSIKLFPNGSIQVAGCSDLFDCKRILGQLAFILKVVLELDELPPTQEASIKMINTNFSLNSSVNLNKVIAKFSARPGAGAGLDSPSPTFKVTFDPDRYSAVKVKFTPKPGQKQVTASIFSTGKIIVTGAQTLDEIAGAYETINKVITTDALVKAVAEPELFNNIMGASFEEWSQVLGEHSSLGRLRTK